MEMHRNKDCIQRQYHKVKKVKTKKSTTPVIENTSRKNVKGRKNINCNKRKKYSWMKYFKIGNYNYFSNFDNH